MKITYDREVDALYIRLCVPNAQTQR
ncbi:MAG: DUF2283 domain-containing protein [Pseudomonadota bacterium]|nr:DUF2283 domain-containing protein [Pseudomonadota bacterium]